MQVTPEQLAAFRALFDGRQDAYGQYERPREELGGEKRLAPRWTVTRERDDYEPLSDKHWQAHLDATIGLGVVPCRLDGSVMFFALDVDKYAVGDELHVKLVQRIDKVGMPLVVTRSKSGGAHVWCFLASPIPATVAIKYLKDWKKLLGFKADDTKVEIFPKQISVEQMDAGSWINLPYFGGNTPYDGRVAIGPRGQAITFEEFLRFANARRIAPEDLPRVGKEAEETRVVAAGIINLEHQQAPPCVQTMLSQGIEEGARNIAAYQLGIYFRKADPDNWAGRLQEACTQHMNPPLGFREVGRVIQSLQRPAPDKYKYKCKEPSMQALCDRGRCVKLVFGVLHGEGENVDTGVVSVKRDPMLSCYTFELQDGSTFIIDTSELIWNPKRWVEKYCEVTNSLVDFPKGFDWKNQVREWLAAAVDVEIGESLSNPGIVNDTFREWVRRSNLEGAGIERALEGFPVYLDEPGVGGNIYFKPAAFSRHLVTVSGIKIEPKYLIDIMQSRMKVEMVKRTIGSHGNLVTLFRVPCPEPWFDVAADGDSDREPF